MSPAVISLVIGLVEELVANEPAIAAEIQSILSGGNPTPDQWATLRASIAAGKYTTQQPPTA